MTDLIPVTTTSVRLRHYADPADGHTHQPEEGWVGSALCDRSIWTDVYDQAALDADRRRWGANPPKRIADLPLCKRCEKKAARLDAEGGAS
jgi:hypothetical protein